jgi:hypothetical protein
LLMHQRCRLIQVLVQYVQLVDFGLDHGVRLLSGATCLSQLSTQLGLVLRRGPKSKKNNK